MRCCAPACTCTSTSARSRDGGTGYSCRRRLPPIPRGRCRAMIACRCTPTPSTYFINQGATGGETIPETPCVVNDAADSLCQFPAFPGTVGWKFHFQTIRDELLNPATGERRFQPDAPRVLPLPALRARARQRQLAVPVPQRRRTRGLRPHYRHLRGPGRPERRLPRAAGRVGRGRSAWLQRDDHARLSKNFLGTEFFQASTTLHELGHTMSSGTAARRRRSPTRSRCRAA